MSSPIINYCAANALEKLTKETKGDFNIQNKPYHYDLCRHTEESYLFSFDHDDYKFDIYLFDTFHKEEICLRYSSEGCDYISVNISDVVRTVLNGRTCNELYANLARIFQECGIIKKV